MAIDLESRANELERLAKALNADVVNQQETARITTAIESLTGALAKLESQLANRQAMDRVDPSGAQVVDLRVPLTDLAKFCATRGRPTPQRIHAATQKVNQQVSDLESSTRGRWEAWAAGQLSRIERHRIAALPPTDRTAAETRIADLASAAKRPPTPSAISIFEYNLKRVRADLDRVDLPDQVLKVLVRFDTSGGVRLSDLSDDELAILRSDASIAAQFSVRRQP